MSFSTQDIELLRKAKQEGKTKEQALALLSQSRTSSTQTPTEKQTDPNSAMSDLRTGFSNAVQNIDAGVDRVSDIKNSDRGTFGKLFGQFTSGLRTAGGALGSVSEGVVRALPGGTTAVDTTQKAVGGALEGAMNTKVGQSVAGTAKAGFEALPESAQRTVSDVGQGVGGALGIAGSLVAPGVGSAAVKTTLKPVAKVMQNVEVPKFTVPTPRVGELITKYRTQLSDIDPKFETVLKAQPDASKTMAYFDQAEKGAMDASQPMATKLASDRAVTAYKTIDKGASEAGKLKSELLDQIANEKIPGNIAGNAIGNVKQTIGDRYGISIDNKGNVSQIAGRMANVDAKSQKLISEYVTMLRELGQAPSARKLDDFVDAAQRMLYKQSSPNLFDVADEPVIAFLKQQTGEINSQLKKNVDEVLQSKGIEGSYADLNQEYADLLEINNALNKRLGTDGDKGASLMKSLFSPQTGEPTRRLFQQIKDKTGIDLFEEATLARFAMESVGDTRSKSLLQQIDSISGDVSKVNLMEPGSWINFIRASCEYKPKQT